MNKNPTKLIETLQEFIRPWNIKEKNMNNTYVVPHIILLTKKNHSIEQPFA